MPDVPTTTLTPRAPGDVLHHRVRAGEVDGDLHAGQGVEAVTRADPRGEIEIVGRLDGRTRRHAHLPAGSEDADPDHGRTLTPSPDETMV